MTKNVVDYATAVVVAVEDALGDAGWCYERPRRRCSPGAILRSGCIHKEYCMPCSYVLKVRGDKVYIPGLGCYQPDQLQAAFEYRALYEDLGGEA